MPTAQGSITIQRPVADVFSFVADGTTGPRWRSGVKDVKHVSGEGVGAVYEQPTRFTEPGLGWDRMLGQYVRGERSRPAWGVAESGFHGLARGKRLGPVRISLKSARDDGALEFLLGSLDPSLRLAFDLEHASWDGVEPRLAAAGAVRVNDLDHAAPFRYLRLREPPYDDEALRALAARVRDADEPVYVFFRHEDEPTAPAYAQRLVELLSAA